MTAFSFDGELSANCSSTHQQGRSHRGGDTGDASPVRPTMSLLHQNDNRHQFVFGADFCRVTWRYITAYN